MLDVRVKAADGQLPGRTFEQGQGEDGAYRLSGWIRSARPLTSGCCEIEVVAAGRVISRLPRYAS